MRVATAGKPVFAVTELIDEAYLLAPPEFQGHHDPHVWMDPGAWAKALEVVRDRLADQQPARRPTIAANAGRLSAQEIAALDAYAERVLASVPPSAACWSPRTTPSTISAAATASRSRASRASAPSPRPGCGGSRSWSSCSSSASIPAVFVETTVPDRNVQALIAGAAARGHEVAIGGALFSDAMGAPGTYEGTYVGMIDHNVTTIARALGGETPPRGLNGLLASLG